MTHRTMNMVGVQSPAKCLGGLVAGVDDARDVTHDNLTSSTPLLNRKVLDVDMAGARGRTTLVHHSNGSLVVHIERGGAELSKAKLM